MLTIPREQATKRKIFAFLEDNDIHTWVVGREQGKNGYQHWQIRFESSAINDDKEETGFKIIKDWFNEAHIEKEASDNYEYEKKEGRYFASDDNEDKIIQRYGQLRPNQRRALDILRLTNDRQIELWIDRKGCSGKSWLCGSLYERRLGFYCPPYLGSVKEIVQWVASGYRGEPYIVIDLPRDIKWSSSLYAGIEAIKDGLVADPRYHATTRNIRGVKVLVLANTCPKLDRLSIDRWVIYEPSSM